jgi:hypothetical protein
MTALVVDKTSAAPVPQRKIRVRVNGKPFIDSITDSKGEFKTGWKVMSASEIVSLEVEVENADGTSESGSVYVPILE